MDGFIEIYCDKYINLARAAVKKALAVYVAATVAFATWCTAFVVLYLKWQNLLVLCFVVNFLFTVVFIFYTVIFFSEEFSAKREKVKFFDIRENAAVEYFTGVFVGKNGTEKICRVEYEKFVFDCRTERTELFVLGGVRVPFCNGKTYDIAAIGNRVMTYRECDNV